ncbi:MAG: hypothetical protein EBX04_13490 [Rhodobacteraceae bacterium]|nr:hypothetical protein [Paracoccaceae bacterium]
MVFLQDNRTAALAKQRRVRIRLTAPGFAGVKIPRNINEPLNSELRLSEQDWRYRVQDFIRASEAAALKMMG